MIVRELDKKISRDSRAGDPVTPEVQSSRASQASRLRQSGDLTLWHSGLVHTARARVTGNASSADNPARAEYVSEGRRNAASADHVRRLRHCRLSHHDVSRATWRAALWRLRMALARMRNRRVPGRLLSAPPVADCRLAGDVAHGARLRHKATNAGRVRPQKETHGDVSPAAPDGATASLASKSSGAPDRCKGQICCKR